MSRVVRASMTLSALALGAGFAGACNNLTSAASYADVTRCTGDACAKQCELHGGNWDMTTSDCTCSCFDQVDQAIGCPPGRTTAPFCGNGCCTVGSLCYTTAKGESFCGARCTTAAAHCGPVCCDGQTCLDADVGACGTDYGMVARSCAGGLVCPAPKLDGTIERADCCESIAVPGGTFSMGRSAGGTDACPAADLMDGSCDPDELPEHEVTVSPYALDRFEVTVGRFRSFVTSWDYKSLPTGAGGDRHFQSAGWQAAWNGNLPGTPALMEQMLDCSSTYQTWTHAAGANEQKPITCVTWFVAGAFCAWDGGRLPTEAEWEFAAANGPANDLYPWGQDALKPSRAVYDCSRDALRCAAAPLLPSAVGSDPSGANTWGHDDLAGNAFEWVLDFWAPYSAAPSTDYFVMAASGATGFRIYRGGSAFATSGYLRAASRTANVPLAGYYDVGFRCARRS